MAYEDCSISPFAHVMSVEQREKLAHALNESIISKEMVAAILKQSTSII